MAELTAYRFDCQAAKRVLHYEPLTGEFRWRETRGRMLAGSLAGYQITIDGRAYLQVGILGAKVMANRLAWFIMTGAWPKVRIGYVNGDTLDNRWTNLTTNSVTGQLCVSPSGRGWYNVKCRVGGRRFDVGTYRDPKVGAEQKAAFLEFAHGLLQSGHEGSHPPRRVRPTGVR